VYPGCETFLSLLTSDDGVHWERPEFDCYRHVTGGPSNIVHASPYYWDSPTILHDPEDSERPWKIVLWQHRSVFLGHSTDGLRWTAPTEPSDVFIPNFGDRTTAFIDRRHPSLIERYHTVELPYSDVELTVSRDTRTWERVRPRTAFFEPPPHGREIGAFDLACATPTNSPPIRMTNQTTDYLVDSLWFYYYGGASCLHRQGRVCSDVVGPNAESRWPCRQDRLVAIPVARGGCVFFPGGASTPSPDQTG
jgi:hypothetical protein